MIITEAIMLILSLVAVLSGATHHLFFLVGLSILLVAHIKHYQSLKDENNANI
jgi:uncharacterized membrane protein YecN with MAPEG domain